jgi:hypothetical protein
VCLCHCDPLRPIFRPVSSRHVPLNMGGFKRAMMRFNSSKNLAPVDADPPIHADAPQVNIPHVDTQLNMHNGFFDDESLVPGQNGWYFWSPCRSFQS